MTTLTAADTTTMVLAEGPFPSGGFWGPFWIVGAIVMVAMCGFAAAGATNGPIGWVFSFGGRVLLAVPAWTILWVLLLIGATLLTLVSETFASQTADSDAQSPPAAVSCTDQDAECPAQGAGQAAS